tara:strand:- start:193 stop:405 length:213 start_codon:yes stop_codon:yes gene_type:complete
MKWIMVIFLCFGQECTTLLGEKFDKAEDCQVQSQIEMTMLQSQYPFSSGEIYCLDEDTFNNWLGIEHTSA